MKGWSNSTLLEAPGPTHLFSVGVEALESQVSPGSVPRPLHKISYVVQWRLASVFVISPCPESARFQSHVHTTICTYRLMGNKFLLQDMTLHC